MQSPPPLDYAPPLVRRTAFRAGLPAHVFTSYAVGLCIARFSVLSDGVEGELVAMSLFVAASPLWVPVLCLLVVLLEGEVVPALWICAYAVLVFLAFRHLRKPRQV